MARRRDLAVAAAFAVIGLVFLVEGRDLTIYADDVPGPGFFPLALSTATLVLSAALAVTVVLAARGSASGPTHRGVGATKIGTAPDDERTRLPAAPQPPQQETAPLRSRLGRAGAVWLAMAVSALLIVPAGFLLAMVAFSAVLLLLIEGERSPRGVAAVVAIPVAAYLLFAVLLDVRLPVGPLGF